MRQRNEPPKQPLPRCFRPRRARYDRAPAMRAHGDYMLARVNIELRIGVASLDETFRVVRASPRRSPQTRARRSDQPLRGAYP